MAADREGRDGPERRAPEAGTGGSRPAGRTGVEIIGVTPFGRPVARLAVAVARAGGLGVLDLGTGRAAALAALAEVGRWWAGPFGVRVPEGCEVRPDDLPDAVRTVLVDAPALLGGALDVAGLARGRRLLVEVVDPAEAAAVLRPAEDPGEPDEPERSGGSGELRELNGFGATNETNGTDLGLSEPGGLNGSSRAAGLDGSGGAGDPNETQELGGPGRAGGSGASAGPSGGPGEPMASSELSALSELDALSEAGSSRTGESNGSRGSGGPVEVAGLVARGSEAGGRIGDFTTFVLLQLLLGDPRTGVPVYAAGGIGPRTAAAAVAGGAAGVVLDVQLALVAEAEPEAEVAAALAATDGGDTRVGGGRRGYARPGAAEAEPLPIGQDGPLAASLAGRYKTAGGVVRAIGERIGEHLRAAVRAAPLAARDRPGGPVLPVVQGPMTRVSDRPEFAAAVAREGGLPFLALALMDGGRVRDLLRDTAALLGGRPFGVGVLGFAPPDVRAEQLAAVRAAAPPYALIAGGRPALAATLEDAGISTYLHVPSPELLERFLDGGARKFVFEGAECGGHVGPRASFPLWEAQVELLLAAGADAAELSVMFAGGVHDERSAAMVAALAGPLAARGADVRVLMGTAYLFTAEAVEAGAIVPGFQDAAVGCAGTALLETAPGHAIRCARTPFVGAFEETRRELIATGMSRREVWRRLEELNLGRLRLAGKGLRRRPGGAEPRPAGPREQREEGLFMIGQVAALRSAPTGVAALHEQVTAGATALLAARAADLGLTGTDAGQDGGLDAGRDEVCVTVSAEVRGAAPDGPRPADVAIIGMACVLPGAPDVHAYWANIVGGVDSVTEVPATRWDPELYFGQGEGRTPSKWGGFIPAVPFDALAYGIPPSALGSIEPVQLLALEVAARTLKDAGYADRPFDRSRTAVVFGADGGGHLGTAYALRALLPSYYGQVPGGLDGQLPRPTEDSFPGVLSNVIAGRIANRLDLGGANLTVDAACAASLAALDAACKELAAGAADMVLCGGADLHNGIQDYLLFSSVQALSPAGRCAAFDASADGIALAEGVACVALKRLADAERDGDRIYAVVKAVAGSSDGRSLGLTAPRAEGQRRALDRAYRRAGVAAADVGLVEAHGTGTEVGDRTELATLAATFADAPRGGVTVGSVKSQIGHAKCAAGLAGLIKTAYALHAGVLPGTLHLSSPNAGWRPDGPLAFGTAARPWPAAPGERYAGVSGFGFGGTNFHAVLTGYDGAPEPASGLAEWPAELFVIRAADAPGARAELDRLRVLLDEGHPLRDLARTAADGEGPVRAAFVATGPADLRGRLDAASAAVEGAAGQDGAPVPGVFTPDGGEPGRVAFLFPGQGSQRPGMLADLFVAFPRLQELLRLGGGRYARAMFPPAAFTPDEMRRQRDALTGTRVAQPALGIAGLAVHRLLGAVGVRPDAAAGHSYGELVALCAAGVFGEAALIELSAARAEAILAAAGDDPGGMAAVGGTAREVAEALADVPDVVVANHNAPRQVVVSGTAGGLARAVAALAARGLHAERLPVACAFHSPVVASAATTLRARLDGHDLRPPAFPVWSNATAAPYGDAGGLADALAGHLAAPVRFAEQIEAMYAAGARVFVEAGPGRVLTGLVGAILGGRPHTAVACDVPGEHGLPRLLTALAELAAAGVPVDPLPLFAGRGARVRTPGAAPAAPGWIVDGHLVRTADGGHPTNALRPAERVRGGTMSDSPSDAQAAVLEFLRAGRELIAAQREVVLRHLGAAAAPQAAVPAVVPGEVPEVMPGPVPEQGPALPAATEEEAVPEPPRDVHATALAVISDRTGYPESMLDADLDLEADLSIDSIKRTVIIGELADRVGLTAAPGVRAADLAIEELSRVTTIAGIVAWFRERLSPQVPEDVPATLPSPEPEPAADPEPAEMEAVAELVASAGDAADRAASGAFQASQSLAVSPSCSSGAAAHVGRSPLSGGPVDDAVPEEPGTRPAPLHARLNPRPDVKIEAPAAVEGGKPEDEPKRAARSRSAGAGGAVVRHVLRTVPAPTLPVPEETGTAFEGRRFLVVDDGCGVALEVADLLERQGARVRTPLEADGACDGLIHLAALRPGAAPVLPGAYEGIRRALAGGARWLVLASGAGGTFGRRFDGGGVGDPAPGAGLRGLARTLALESPDVLVRAVDVDTKDTPRAIALRLVAELLDADGPVAVGHEGDLRRGLSAVPAELTGDARLPALDADGVVLLTGGARGITARTALELARTSGCHIEVLGRTPEPAGEPAFPDARGEAGLRRALVARGGKRPAEIEAAIRRITADREIRANLAALREHAASVRYHAADVRDARAVRDVVDGLYRRHGRLDGVVHGAGIVEDRLVRDKDPESFARVYGVKVDGARALVAAVRPDVGFFVVFGSVAGVHGNRGQADYAAANDACDTLAHTWRTRLRGRVLAADWGPWAGGGMVTPELAREYARRGVGLIDPDAGVAALLREIAHGDETQVVFTGTVR